MGAGDGCHDAHAVGVARSPDFVFVFARDHAAGGVDHASNFTALDHSEVELFSR